MSSSPSALRTRWRQPLLAGIAAFAVVAAARYFGAMEPIELAAWDAGTRARAPLPSAHVVLVVEREQDLQRYGFPLADARVADLVAKLAAHGAQAIGIDKYRDLPVAPGSERLRQTIARQENAVWAYKFALPGETGIRAPEAATRPEQVGFNDIVVDRDGVVRRALLFLDDGSKVYESFALNLALRYLAARGVAPEADAADPQAMRLGHAVLSPLARTDGGYSVADAAGFQVPLAYRAGADAFVQYSLEDAFEGRIPAGALQGKLVVFGSVAESLKDTFDTPLQRVGRGGRPAFGVEVHAQIADQLVREALGESPRLRWWPDWAEYAVAFVACLLGAVVGRRVRSPAALAAAVGGGAAGLAGASVFGVGWGWWLALVPAALGYALGAVAATAWRAFAEFKERRAVMRLFARYVSKEVADEIWAQRGQFMADGKPKPRLLTATVLFSDVAGFTSVSEKMSPQDLFAWLDRYMAAMSQAVITHRGVINKFIGDAVMALYGVPVSAAGDDAERRNALDAVASAIDMGRALEALNREGGGAPAIRMRVGICTGPLAAGTVGSGDRLEFTVLGDTVNVASRLESLKTVEFDGLCRILVCAETWRLVSDRFEGRPVGEIALKGKDRAVAVYEIQGDAK